jgi:peptidoglycan hydrolase-like protein with peptidoglycan-binding domain
MPELISPRLFGEDVLESCLSGHSIFVGGSDPPESVASLQRALADLGFVIAVDGVFGFFGTKTGRAVSTYEKAEGPVTAGSGCGWRDHNA